MAIILGTIYWIIRGTRKKSKEKVIIKEREENKEYDELGSLADELGVTTALLKLRLGIPFDEVCLAKTAEEARKIFLEDSSRWSEEELAGLLRWIELEDSLENMSDLYGYAKQYNGFLAKLVVNKWELLTRKELEKIGMDDKEKLMHLYALTISGSESERIVMQKLNRISKQKI